MILKFVSSSLYNETLARLKRSEIPNQITRSRNVERQKNNYL